MAEAAEGSKTESSSESVTDTALMNADQDNGAAESMRRLSESSSLAKMLEPLKLAVNEKRMEEDGKEGMLILHLYMSFS